MTVDDVEYSLLMVLSWPILSDQSHLDICITWQNMLVMEKRGDSLELDHIKEGSLVLDLYLRLVEC